MKQVEARWEKKRIGEAEQAKDAAADRTARDSYLGAKESGAPPRLTSMEYDPATGRITWPVALRAARYAESRADIELLFSLRAAGAEIAGLSQSISNACRDLQDELRENILESPSNEYLAARKFLESLAWEGRQPQ